MPDTTRAPSATSPPNGLSSDAEFDRCYDAKIRRLSLQHWTPVRVAVRAAQLLTEAGATRILDVGSGVGKFCIIGALSTDAEFVGVERRGRLVRIARGAALHHGAHRATFVHANIDAFSFDGFSGIYLYNPFYEQISDLMVQIDGAIERSKTAYRHFVGSTTAKLAAMATPVAVATYNGFGGDMSPAFTLMAVEPAGSDRLELWVKI
jgi:hypothetical protein